VFWMGRDDNKPSGLYGATGSLRAWQELFRKLPTKPLSAAPGDGLELAWINPSDGKRTEQGCEGARQLPVVAGTLSADAEGCFWQHVGNLFGGGDQGPAPASTAPSRD
jgi:penicillin-binding protein 1B